MTQSKKTQHILAVDDSPDTLEVLKRNLESKGYRVTTTTGAIKGIRILNPLPLI